MRDNCRYALVHATCVRLDDAARFGAPKSAGVLLLGKSGAGKSDLALRLMALGAKLVADDYTELTVKDGALVARPPAAIAGLIEVRGLGILAQPYARGARIALAVELTAKVPRLPPRGRWRLPKNLANQGDAAPPLVKIAPFEPAAAAKLVMAVAAFHRGLHRDGVRTI